jgi:hypothetical protein
MRYRALFPEFRRSSILEYQFVPNPKHQILPTTRYSRPVQEFDVEIIKRRQQIKVDEMEERAREYRKERDRDRARIKRLPSPLSLNPEP